MTSRYILLCNGYRVPLTPRLLKVNMFAVSVIGPGNRQVPCIQPLVRIHRLLLILLIPGTAGPSVGALIMYRIPAAEVMILFRSIVLKQNQGVSAGLEIQSIARGRNLYKLISPENCILLKITGSRFFMMHQHRK